MKDLIGKLVSKKDLVNSSSSRYGRLCCKDECASEIRRGYVPVMVGEEEERFMVPMGWMNKPCVLALLELSANEYGYHQEGVLHIPCDPHVFRDIVGKLSSKKKYRM